MRIVHEIHGKSSASGGGDLYAPATGQAWEPNGRVEILITAKGIGREEETIYIEGDCQAVLQALRKAVDVAVITLEHFKEDSERLNEEQRKSG